jgi:hypothetical protein
MENVSIFYGRLVLSLVVILYIFPVLVYCVKKNLATLKKLGKNISQSKQFPRDLDGRHVRHISCFVRQVYLAQQIKRPLILNRFKLRGKKIGKKNIGRVPPKRKPAATAFAQLGKKGPAPLPRPALLFCQLSVCQP